MSQKVLVVEDELPMQARLLRILGTVGCAEHSVLCAASIAQARTLADGHALATALIDLGLPDGSGIDLIGWLHSNNPSLPILVVSAWTVEERIVDALRAGASGYLLKERDDLEIAMSLRTLSKGGVPIDPFVARKILGLFNEATRYSSGVGEGEPKPAKGIPLSKREQTILLHVAQGMSNRNIADALGLSRWTIDTHLRHIYSKLSVNSRTQAVRAAHLHGLFR